MWPSASATCSAVRSWCSASSSLALVGRRERAPGTVQRVRAARPSSRAVATSTLRTALDRDRTGDGGCSSCARFTARYVAAAAPNAPTAAATQVLREGTVGTVAKVPRDAIAVLRRGRGLPGRVAGRGWTSTRRPIEEERARTAALERRPQTVGGVVAAHAVRQRLPRARAGRPSWVAAMPTRRSR